MSTTLYTHNGRVITQGAAFTANDLQFPANWLDLATDDDLAAQNIVRQVMPDPPPTPEQVETERDRRIARFVFRGRAFDGDGSSYVNIAVTGTLALAAIISGASAGDLRWKIGRAHV